MPEIKKRLAPVTTSAIYSDDDPSRLSGIVFFLLCTMLVFSVVAFGAVDVWALAISSVFAGLIVIFWAADALFKKELRLTVSSLQIPLAGLIAIGLIQLLPLRSLQFPAEFFNTGVVNSLSIAPYSTRLAIIQLVIYFVFFAAALTFINSYNRYRTLTLTIIIFGSIMAFFGIMQRFANIESIYGVRNPGQAFSFASFINQHHFAAFMEMTIGLTLGLLFGNATKINKRILLLFLVIVMGMGLIFTSSRGGMLSLLGVIAFIVAANLLKRPSRGVEEEEDKGLVFRRNFALIGGGLSLIVILFSTVLLLGGDESLVRGVGLSNMNDISNGRTHFWRVALEIFINYPILGAGLDAFGIAFPQYDTWNGTFRVEQAHNDYLQILADAGIAGFACVAAFIFLLFKKSPAVIGTASDRFARGAATGALAGCFGILIHSFFDFPLRTPSNALFFLTLVVLTTTPVRSPKPLRRRIKY